MRGEEGYDMHQRLSNGGEPGTVQLYCVGLEDEAGRLPTALYIFIDFHYYTLSSTC